jgi:hypothetical protein
VNVLLAFHDRWHVHHQLVRPSQPTYPNPTGGLQTLVALVRSFRDLPGHHFWPDDISIGDVLEPAALVTHTHLTDVYLLALAVKNGKLATLDDRVPMGAIRGGHQAIEVLRP